MKINNLKINSFGNLNNKEIELSNNINIIQGKNESGKSTLLKFITDMFYGISKNKRGKDFSDYDRYKPWNNEEFSGKLSYTLDNEKKYEIFRDFNKKNPKIYNELSEDISKEFNIDKLTGNQFFIEQTGIDENLFLSTLASMQQEVKLDKQTQNSLIQKVANFVNTGDDNISYKKALEKINKKQIEEIGTNRSQGRPINIINEKIEKLENEKNELINLKNNQYEIEELKNNLKNKIIEDENKLNLIKEINLLNEKEKIEKEKINLNRKIIFENNEKIKNLNSEREKIKKQLQENENDSNKDYGKLEKDDSTDKIESKIIRLETKSKRLKIFLFAVELILIILSVITFMLIENKNFSKILTTTIPITFLYFLWIIFRNKKLLKMEKNKQQEKIELSISQKNIKKDELKNELHKIEVQIEVLEKNVESQNIDIQKLEQKNEEELNFEKQKIINNCFNKLNIKNIELPKKNYEKIDEIFNIENNNMENLKNVINNYFNNKNLNEEINLLENNLNNNKLEIHSLELDKNNLIPKLEKLSFLEEELENLNENKKELLKENESIELAKELLEIAYNKMKSNVTPKFTNNLSKNIEKISNGKYKNVRVNDEEGIVVEKENGEYVEIEKLSVGTIEQLYLSLRFSMINEISKETMPIILDEAFAYYDEERLSNILKYLNDEYKNNQIIIFTCTNREIKILDENNIKYNLIKL